MTPRDALGMLLVVAGLALGGLGWSIRDTWLMVIGAVLFAAGILRIWTRERDRRISEATADVHEGGYGWRIGRRRDDGAGDADGHDGGFGGDGD